MVNLEIFTKVEPSFEKVLQLKNNLSDLGDILNLLKKYRNEIIKNYDGICESDNYLYCQRAVNLLGWHKKSGGL